MFCRERGTGARGGVCTDDTAERGRDGGKHAAGSGAVAVTVDVVVVVAAVVELAIVGAALGAVAAATRAAGGDRVLSPMEGRAETVTVSSTDGWCEKKK